MSEAAINAIGGALWLALAGLALHYGGRTERIATAALLVGWLVALSAHVAVDPLARASVSPIILVADSIQLGLLVALARDPNRPWMAGAAACMAAVVMVQLIALFNPNVLSIGYLVTQSAASFGVMAFLVHGALRVRAGNLAS
ncbi:MAG: hypothetical protein J0L52_04250 [Caulobacterales bacterium]|nr:hypothetical protein [Caulobacterales bacterium]